MNGKAREKLNGTVEVPAWVMAVTYILCWSFAVALIVGQMVGHLTYRPLLIAISIYLLLWPVFQISPAEMIQKVFPK